MGNSNQHFNSYLSCNYLLIQFILTELIRTHALTRHLKYLSTHFATSPFTLKELLPQVAHDIMFLLGTSHENNRPWASHWRAGSLAKLKNYSEHLSLNAAGQNKVYTQIYEEFFRAWMSCVRCYEIVKSAEREATPFTAASASPVLFSLNRGLITFHANLITVEKLILKTLRHFSANENVLLFLLRRKEDLSAVFGSNNISDILAGNVQFLQQNYAERGFENLADILCQV